MSATAKTATVRLVVSVITLVTAILGLLGAIVRLLGALVGRAHTALQAKAQRGAQAAAPRHEDVAQPFRPTLVAPPPYSGRTEAPRPALTLVPSNPSWAVSAPTTQAPVRTGWSPAPAAATRTPQLVAPAAPFRPTPKAPRAFVLPAVDCLVEQTPDASASVSRDHLEASAAKLTAVLAQHGVQGKVEDILPGPTVTTYEFSPAAGTKVSKVARLVDDVSLALSRKVRILAPIPGKDRIGFEVPSERSVPVVLRDLIEDRRFQSMDVPLPVVLGRDTQGQPVYADLASMPHVIVAGATGAGKSVGLNVMLLSLLYRRSPEELRLLMIDPKVVELAPYNRMPHMLQPVVTDMKKASQALKWAVDEMERRYQVLAAAGTKNIASYNAWVGRVARGEVANPGAGMDGVAASPEKLPWIVIVIDEFADLMMQNGKEVEATVSRLAQKARAAGIHVILATQRPSVDVITGVIKANFPTRIAYRVSQKVDSRIILDEQGAEHLLGNGDMLVKRSGAVETQRVQCPWVSEDEVQRVTDFLRAQGEPVYNNAILSARDEQPEVRGSARRHGLRVA